MSAGQKRELPDLALGAPFEVVLLSTLIHLAAEKLLEHLEVDLLLDERLSKQRVQTLEVLDQNVGQEGLRVVD